MRLPIDSQCDRETCHMNGWIPGWIRTATRLWTGDRCEADGEGQRSHRRDFHSKLEDQYWSVKCRILPHFGLLGFGNVAKSPLKKRKGVPKEWKNSYPTVSSVPHFQCAAMCKTLRLKILEKNEGHFTFF